MALAKVSPGMRLFWAAFAACILGTLSQLIAFVSPYWYQSWRRVHSPLANVGLWHICLSGYVKPRDPTMQSYVGCWWIHSTFFRDVADFIMPPWFRACQALGIFELLCNLAIVLLLVMYIAGESTRRKFYADRHVLMFIINSVICFASALFVFIMSLVFAEMARQENYFPRPWMNYLSWSFGFNVLSGFFMAFAGICLFIKSMILKDKLFEEPSSEIEKELRMTPRQGAESIEGTGSKVGESFV
ncbi:hypothetical protein ACJMK2_004450 [Sinanodonta woodiana]|uniref:Uncharacterized protein n=1 Tax=Sinanodonta woodiana TaxID=1069815 RepID=A0ABD3Y172_SINWO